MPLNRRHIYRMLPAIAKRIAAIRKGGNDTIANLIAIYVDPQIKYTALNAAINVNRDAELFIVIFFSRFGMSTSARLLRFLRGIVVLGQR